MIEYFDPKFYGTEKWYKHPLDFLFVDSVRYFCEEHHAFWTLDVIGSYVSIFKKYSFLTLHFDVQESKCYFYAQEDKGLPKIVEQNIEFTDLDVSVLLFWENGVILFPSDR